MNELTRILICATPCLISLGCLIAFCSKWASRNIAQRTMAVIMLLSFIGSVYFFIFQIPAFQRAYRLDWVLTSLFAFIPATYHLFICRLTGTGKRVRLWSYATPVALSFISLVLYMAMGEISAGDYMQQVKLVWPVHFGTMPIIWKVKYIFSAYIFRGVVILQFILASVLTIGSVRRFHSDLKDFYADAATKRFHSGIMLSIAAVTFLISAVLLTFGPYHLFVAHFNYVIPAVVVFLISAVCVTVYCLKQPVTADNLIAFKEDTKNMGQAVKNKSNLQERLSTAIDEEFYTDSAVTVMTLSEKLGTNPQYLSDLIHITYGVSFADFVNDLRIKKAISEMRSVPVNSPLTKVANMCGYSSYSEFAHYFEEFAHLTPSEWMKRYR